MVPLVIIASTDWATPEVGLFRPLKLNSGLPGLIGLTQIGST